MMPTRVKPISWETRLRIVRRGCERNTHIQQPKSTQVNSQQRCCEVAFLCLLHSPPTLSVRQAEGKPHTKVGFNLAAMPAIHPQHPTTRRKTTTVGGTTAVTGMESAMSRWEGGVPPSSGLASRLRHGYKNRHLFLGASLAMDQNMLQTPVHLLFFPHSFQCLFIVMLCCIRKSIVLWQQDRNILDNK